MSTYESNHLIPLLFNSISGLTSISFRYSDSQYIFIKNINEVPWFKTINLTTVSLNDEDTKSLLVESNLTQSKFELLIKFLKDNRPNLQVQNNTPSSFLYMHPLCSKVMNFKSLFEESLTNENLQVLITPDDLAVRNLFNSSPSLSFLLFSSYGGFRIVVNNRYIGLILNSSSEEEIISKISKEIITCPEDKVDCQTLVSTAKILLSLNSQINMHDDFAAYRNQYV